VLTQFNYQKSYKYSPFCSSISRVKWGNLTLSLNSISMGLDGFFDRVEWRF